MPIHQIPLEKITPADIQSLVANGEREDSRLEYKREWRTAAESDKRELLSDIAAFANAAGGDIIYGIECGKDEQQGVPVAVYGLAGFEVDKEELTMHGLEKAWIAPRLIGTRTRLVDMGNGLGVFVVRIAPGVRRPHMVKYREIDRFYSRHANGRYRLDVDQIRRSVLDTEGAETRLLEFRIDRVDRIVRKAIEINVTKGLTTSVVLHIQPIAEWELFDFNRVQAISANNRNLWPWGNFQSYSPPAINYEGCVAFSSDSHGAALSYVQLFRNGSIEAWCARYTNAERFSLPASYEEEIRKNFGGYLAALRALEVSGPYLVGLTLVNVLGLQLGGTSNSKLQQNVLMIPGRITQGEGESVDSVLRPIFDRAWNACGVNHSPNYDAAGNWRTPQR